MGDLLSFRRAPAGPPVPLAPQRVKGMAIALEARPGAVCLVVGDTELWLDPAQTRELATDLHELADDAESRRGG